jgi:hypothetical protein
VTLPRYPIYVPTKGRYRKGAALTVRFLMRDEVPFRAVVEREEVPNYAPLVGEERLLILPQSGNGLLYARNWIKQHSIDEGHARHWQLDDNIRQVKRTWRGKRIPCNSGPAFAAAEDFADRYENVGLLGFNYEMFVMGPTRPAFVRNAHVYSCTLVDNSMPYRWRLVYNDDTDLCLQVLAGGLCTVLLNVFCCEKAATMKFHGGNTDALYQGDGRLRMARQLERMWPGVVTVDRRWGRPQHIVKAAWTKFDTPRKLKPGVDLEALRARNEYGMELRELAPVRSPRLRAIQEDYASRGE